MGHKVHVPVENLAGVVFEYSADRRRLLVRIPVQKGSVVVDLSRSAAELLAERVAARVPGMAEPEVPVQNTGVFSALMVQQKGGVRW
jgi:hypothetical protein